MDPKRSISESDCKDTYCKMSVQFKIVPLNKDNFSTWKVHMKATMIRNGTWKYVTKEKPNSGENADKFLEWQEEEAKAQADLILGISASELIYISDCTSAHEIWQKLHSIYESKGPAKKANLLKTLILLKMKSGADMREHVKAFFDVVEKLKIMELDINDELLSILLLYSIPDEYEPFRIAVETQEKLMTSENLKIKLLEEYEARNRNKRDDNNDDDALLVRGGKMGRPKFKCFNCGKIGHLAKNCRFKSYGNPQEASNWVEEAMCIGEAANPNLWCLDSGATSHMCVSKSKFAENFKSGSSTLNLANDMTSEIKGNGEVKLKCANMVALSLKRALYVPELRKNLLSVSKITDKGFDVVFKKDRAIVVDPNRHGKVILEAEREKDLYYVHEVKEEAHIAEDDKLMDWHEKLGHLNEADLKKVLAKTAAPNDRNFQKSKLPVCETCIKGKQTQLPYTQSLTKTKSKLELIHTDVCGPMRVQSHNGSRYFVTFIDDKTKWCEVYFIKKKNEVAEKFKLYKAMVENRTGNRIKTVRSDNGTEFKCHEMEDYLKLEGIRHELSVEYTPQQNGVAERKNRTLVEMARCLLIRSNLPPVFWAEALNTANYIRNRCPSSSIKGEIPFNLWNEKMACVSHLQKFGSIAYMLNKQPQRGKFDPKSTKCIFIGYSDVSKAYRLWDPVKRKVVCSRDVKFTNFFQNEEQFQEFSSYETDHQIEVEMTPEEDNQQIPNIQMAQMHLNTNSNGENEMGSSGSENDESDEYRTPASTVKKSRGRPKFLRTGKRGRPRKLFHMVEEENNQTDITEETNKKHENMANLAEINDPSTVSEALSSENSKEWKAALQAEYDALTKNKTWSIVDCPNNKEIIGCRWILRTKYNADGTVERRKARLVAKGYDQKPGIDFEETFAPVARMESVRLLMAISVESGLELFQLDFVSAYLNGDIEEQIFMSIPQEFYMLATEEEKNDFKGNKVCLIKKALYGLKQSGRQWYKKLDEKLKILGMKPLDSDPCVYVHKIETNMLIVLIYVDDLIVATNNQTLLQRLKHELSTSFEMKDLGRLKYCLGVEFEQSEDLTQIRMKQNKYTKDILKRFNMADSKGAKTPLDPSEKLSKEMCPKTQEEKLEMERIPYQNLIGSLMYLAVSTRPDIAHAVSMLSQFNTNFGQQHWTAAKRVLRYLKHKN